MNDHEDMDLSESIFVPNLIDGIDYDILLIME